MDCSSVMGTVWFCTAGCGNRFRWLVWWGGVKWRLVLIYSRGLACGTWPITAGILPLTGTKATGLQNDG